MDSDEHRLFRCIERGDIDGALECIANGVDPNVGPPYYRDTAFITAIRDHRDDSSDLQLATLVRHMIQAGADPNARSSSGTPILHTACACSMMYVVSSLLDAHADPNIQDQHGLRPLMIAGSIPIMDLLLQAGADPNATDLQGLTALFYKCEQLDAPKARYLLKHSPIPVNVNLASIEQQETCLMVLSTSIEEMYLADQIDDDEEIWWDQHDGEFKEDAKEPDDSAYVDSALAIARDIVAHGADLEARTIDGYTVLLLECKRVANMRSRDWRFIIYLIDQGADPNVSVVRNPIDHFVDSPLNIVALYIHTLKLFDYLLSLKPSQYILDTCLVRLANPQVDLYVLNQLLAHGANPNAFQPSALRLTIRAYHMDIKRRRSAYYLRKVEILMAYGADFSQELSEPIVQQVLQQWRMEQEALSSETYPDMAQYIHDYIKPRKR